VKNASECVNCQDEEGRIKKMGRGGMPGLEMVEAKSKPSEISWKDGSKSQQEQRSTLEEVMKRS
jgi:hypothetical protein